MKSKKLPFSKPKPNHKCKLYSFGNHIDLETTAKERKTNICRYRKISKHEVLDTVTNKVIICNSNVVKDEKLVFKKFKIISRVILTNFFGTNAEELIKAYYDEKPTNIYTDGQYFIRKLERRVKQKLHYIVVLQYQNNGLPRLEIWIKTASNSKINLTHDIVKECWKMGNVETIEITPTNVIELAQYFLPNSHSRFDLFPINAKLYHTSRNGIKKVTAEILDYEEAEKRVTGMERTFASTKAFVETVNGKEIVCQQVSYESYSAPKEDTKTQNIVTS